MRMRPAGANISVQKSRRYARKLSGWAISLKQLPPDISNYMKPRKPCIVTLATIAFLSTPASAQKRTLEGIARSASLYAAIVEFCPQHQRIDLELATRAAKAMADAASEASGPAMGRMMLDQEMQRRFDIVRSSGAEAWCQAQRQRPANEPLFLKAP